MIRIVFRASMRSRLYNSPQCCQMVVDSFLCQLPGKEDRSPFRVLVWNVPRGPALLLVYFPAVDVFIEAFTPLVPIFPVGAQIIVITVFTRIFVDILVAPRIFGDDLLF